MSKTILLDIDGVLVTTPGGKPVEQLADGFMKFNEVAVEQLAILYRQTNASVILTTTHRVNFGEEEWKSIFKTRGLDFQMVTKVNDREHLDLLADRATEIKEWVTHNGGNENNVIIDDDLSLNGLDENIKSRWVQTKPLIRFDESARKSAFRLLTNL